MNRVANQVELEASCLQLNTVDHVGNQVGEEASCLLTYMIRFTRG